MAMKLKAVLINFDPHASETDALLEALHSAALLESVEDRVIRGALRSSEMGPAEWYLQECDMGRHPSGKRGVEVRLTGVSKTWKRSDADFTSAREELLDIYRKAIEKNLSARRECQLFVAVMVDAPVQLENGISSPIVESAAPWIKDKKKPRPSTAYSGPRSNLVPQPFDKVVVPKTFLYQISKPNCVIFYFKLV